MSTPSTWARVSASVIEAEREAQRAVAEAFEALRQRLQLVALAEEPDDEAPDDDG